MAEPIKQKETINNLSNLLVGQVSSILTADNSKETDEELEKRQKQLVTKRLELELLGATAVTVSAIDTTLQSLRYSGLKALMSLVKDIK